MVPQPLYNRNIVIKELEGFRSIAWKDMLLECGSDTASPAKVKEEVIYALQKNTMDRTKSSDVVLPAPVEDCLKIIFIHCSTHLPKSGKKRQLSPSEPRIEYHVC
ncbi:hypothetical protein E2542_SST25670 [Spatholobus suberectus]|nr:hypothetical protein E2542_SST25670 [Spatholobus suberectus]